MECNSLSLHVLFRVTLSLRSFKVNPKSAEAQSSFILVFGPTINTPDIEPRVFL